MAAIIRREKKEYFLLIDKKVAGLRRKAFTLIEVLSVAVFLSIISMAVIQGFEHSVKKEKEERLRGALNLMRGAVDRYYLDRLAAEPGLTHEKRFPSSLQELVDKKYLRSVPDDPVAGGRKWEIIYVSETEKRVFDFKSTARGAALDGTLYSNW
jgi:general secretion pathway protein G